VKIKRRLKARSRPGRRRKRGKGAQGGSEGQSKEVEALHEESAYTRRTGYEQSYWSGGGNCRGSRHNDAIMRWKGAKLATMKKFKAAQKLK